MKPRQTLLLVASFLLFAAPQPAFGQIPESKILSGLEDVLQTVGPDSLLPVIVALEGERSFTVAERQVMLGMVRSSRQTFVARERVNFAKQRREVLMEAVGAAEELGFARNVRPLSIVNAVALQGTPSFVRSIATRSEVLWIGLDSPISVFRSDRGNASVDAMLAVSQSPWGLTAIRADEVWDLGLAGQGVLIMTIDTGIRMSHVDLRDRLWDGRGVVSGNVLTYEGQPLVNHGWDTIDQDNNPAVTLPVIDLTDHGTRVAGIVAGDGTSGTSTGVAPEAQLLIMRSFTNTAVDIAGSESWILQAFSWIEEMKAIHGVEFEVPAVVNLSAGVTFNGKPKYALWRDAMNDMFDLDVVVIAAAGNSGTVAENPGQNYCNGDFPIGQRIPYNVATPANVPSPWLHPDQPAPAPGASGPHVSAVLAVGATGEFDEHREYSSIGPSAWENIESIYACQDPIPSTYWDFLYETGGPNGLIKPDLVAPDNVLTTSAYGDSEHRMFTGTSAAAPHVAGTAALLISASEGISPAQLAEALQSSAFDGLPTGKDNYFGAGRIDAYAAIIYVLENFGGTIGGAGMTVTLSEAITVAAGNTLTVREGTTLNLDQNLTISSGATLVVEEDVTIKLAANKSIKGYGLVKLLGTSQDPIVLERSGTGKWYYLLLYNSGANNSQIKHVIIDNAKYGLYAGNVSNLWVEDLTSKYNQYYGFRPYSLTGSEIHNSSLHDNGIYGLFLQSGGLKIFDSAIYDNSDGVYVYAGSAAFGEGGTGGYNAIYDNSDDGVIASQSSIDLGEAGDIQNPDGYAGYNDICGNSGDDVYATNSSDVMAEENYWGEYTPDTLDFNITGGSTFDYQPYHNDDNTGLCTQSKTSGTPRIVIEGADADVGRVHGAAGVFVRWAQRIRDDEGRAAAVTAMEKAVADPSQPYRAIAQGFRLYDLIHLGRVDEAIAVGEAELAQELIAETDRAFIARPLFDAYVHEKEDGLNAGRMKAILDMLGDEDVATGLLDAEMAALGLHAQQEVQGSSAADADESPVEVYPNPFNPAATIAYSLTSDARVQLKIYDVLGREVARLVDAPQSAGRHEAVFDGSSLPTGVYLYRLEAGTAVQSGSVILMK